MIWILGLALILSLLLNCAQWFERMVLNNIIAKMHDREAEQSHIGFTQANSNHNP